VKEEIYDLKRINIRKSVFPSFNSRQLKPDQWTEVMRASPVIFGSLCSRNFLNEQFRQDFFLSSRCSENTLTIPTTRSIWKPIEYTNEVVELFAELERQELHRRNEKKIFHLVA
jgi:hypothetical protein